MLDFQGVSVRCPLGSGVASTARGLTEAALPPLGAIPSRAGSARILHSPHRIFEAPCLSPALLNAWDPEMLGCEGAGRIKQGPGPGPAFSRGLQGPDPVSSCHPEAPRPSGRAGAVCARGRAGAARARGQAGALGPCVPEAELGQYVPWPVPWALGSLPAAGVVTAESPLFSSVGKVGPTPRPDRMWPGWLPAPSRRWPLFSDASRGPDPPATGTPRPWRGVLA